MKNQVFHLANCIKDYSVIKKAGRGGGTYGEKWILCVCVCVQFWQAVLHKLDKLAWSSWTQHEVSKGKKDLRNHDDLHYTTLVGNRQCISSNTTAMSWGWKIIRRYSYSITCTLLFSCIVIITLCAVNKQVCVNCIIYRDLTVETRQCCVNSSIKKVWAFIYYTDLIHTVATRCRCILKVCFLQNRNSGCWKLRGSSDCIYRGVSISLYIQTYTPPCLLIRLKMLPTYIFMQSTRWAWLPLCSWRLADTTF